MVKSSPELRAYTQRALQYVFDVVNDPGFPAPERQTQLRALAEAYQGCQAEQARVIDQVYGQLSGRESTLQKQTLALLNRHKEIALLQVVLHTNPDAQTNKRLPHIQSRYRIELGRKLGLSGVSTARLDPHKDRPVDKARRYDIERSFRALFSPQEFVEALVADINQQDPLAERFIMRECLINWANPAALRVGDAVQEGTVWAQGQRTGYVQQINGTGTATVDWTEQHHSTGSATLGTSGMQVVAEQTSEVPSIDLASAKERRVLLQRRSFLFSGFSCCCRGGQTDNRQAGRGGGGGGGGARVCVCGRVTGRQKPPKARLCPPPATPFPPPLTVRLCNTPSSKSGVVSRSARS